MHVVPHVTCMLNVMLHACNRGGGSKFWLVRQNRWNAGTQSHWLLRVNCSPKKVVSVLGSPFQFFSFHYNNAHSRTSHIHTFRMTLSISPVIGPAFAGSVPPSLVNAWKHPKSLCYIQTCILDMHELYQCCMQSSCTMHATCTTFHIRFLTPITAFSISYSCLSMSPLAACNWQVGTEYTYGFRYRCNYAHELIIIFPKLNLICMYGHYTNKSFIVSTIFFTSNVVYISFRLLGRSLIAFSLVTIETACLEGCFILLSISFLSSLVPRPHPENLGGAWGWGYF